MSDRRGGHSFERPAGDSTYEAAAMKQETKPRPASIHTSEGLVYVDFDDGHCVTFVPFTLDKKLQYLLRNFQLKYEGILVAQFNAWLDEKLRVDEFIKLSDCYTPARVLAYWEQALEYAKEHSKANLFSAPAEYAHLVAQTSRRPLKSAKKCHESLR